MRCGVEEEEDRKVRGRIAGCEMNGWQEEEGGRGKSKRRRGQESEGRRMKKKERMGEVILMK